MTAPSRPHCAAFLGISLDGYIARPDGGIDWLHRYDIEGEDYGYHAFFAEIDALVLGRGTYDVVRGFAEWPYGGKRCIVLTHRPAPSSHGEEFYAGEPGPLLEKLAQDGVRRVYVDGGAVVRQFLAARALDELTLSILPIILGAGIRLFAGTEPEVPLTLAACRTWPNGLVQLRYRLQ